MLTEYIAKGGLDAGYPTTFNSLSDKDKRTRAREFMDRNTPYWGGRKFIRLWNKMTINGGAVIKTNYTTFSKSKLAEYFCNNNPYGITAQDMSTKDPSGTVVKKGNVTYGIYFVNSKSEPSGALPTNASNCRYKKNIDHMIVVAAINQSDASKIAQDRVNLENKLTEWNQNIPKVPTFDEIFWMPQTQAEYSQHILAGTWVAQNKV